MSAEPPVCFLRTPYRISIPNQLLVFSLFVGDPMHPTQFVRRFAFLLMAALSLSSLTAPGIALASEAPLLLRFPTLSQTTIAFRYADDIWTVSRSGGEAQRLTSTGNVVAGPFFSPDGSQIAYSARLHGNEDAYILPAVGGIPRRITWHPAGTSVVGWSPDGKDVLVASQMQTYRRFLRLFRVHADGSGIPQALPLPSGVEGSFSPDGLSIAYQPITRWEPAWKQYHGGQNFPIWVVNLKTLDLEKIPGSGSWHDSNPVWVGDQIYFLSDRAGSASVQPDGGQNGPVALYRYDIKTKQISLAVENKTLDFKTFQAGPGGLVYEQFGSLHLIDLKSPNQLGEDHTLQITIHGDLSNLAPHLASITPDEIQNAALSPTGARAVIEAHGEIFTVPAEKGDTRNLTNTSNAAERSPAWSPDGKTIAYFSDASGEYQLYLREQNGFKTPTAVDLGPNPSFFYALTWSPDSKRLLYSDKHLHLWYIDAPARDDKGKETPAGKPVLVDTSHADPFAGGGFGATWSPDSRWIAYTRDLDNSLNAVFLYSLETHKFTQVTDGMSDAVAPVFDANGKYLYFLASTDDGPSKAGIDLSSLDRAQTTAAYVVVLSKDEASPLPPESDDKRGKKQRRKTTKSQRPRPGPPTRKRIRRTTSPLTRPEMARRKTRPMPGRWTSRSTSRISAIESFLCPFPAVTTPASSLEKPAWFICWNRPPLAAPPAKAGGRESVPFGASPWKNASRSRFYRIWTASS